MKRMLRFLSLIVVLSGFTTSVWAACSSPSGTTAEIIYNADYGVMQFCNGTLWVSLGNNDVGGGVSTLPALTDVTLSSPASGDLLYYNGSAWINQASSGLFSADSITSGTTSVTANTTGYISLTTGGATTGYFDTAGRLIAPGISLTSMYGISSSNAYISNQLNIRNVVPVADYGLVVGGSSTEDGITIRLEDSASNDAITTYAGTNLTHQLFTSTNDGVYKIYSEGSVDKIQLHSAGLSYFNGGNVGIGTVTPDASLTVVGLVSATGVSVSGIVTATYFEGDGSRLTGIAGGDADRIVSGTTSAIITNEGTGYISLTTTAGAAAWGYLGSSATYLPNLNSNLVSSTRVSATTISASIVQIASPTSTVTCSSSTAGALKYNSTGSYMEMCNGTSWQPMGVGVPAGTISAFASTTCPTGWSEYTAARGYFLRGIDPSGTADPDGVRAPGATQTDAFQGHMHKFGGTGTRGTGDGAPDTNGYNSSYIYPWPSTGGLSQASYWTMDSDGTNGTPRTAAETRPKNIAVTYCQFNGTTNGWNSALAGSGATELNGLTDVTLAGPASGDLLYYNGSSWVNQASSGLFSADSITSGTTKVTANTTGYISFTTGGTTTGYFDTAGRLIAPGISLTSLHGISSTTGDIQTLTASLVSSTRVSTTTISASFVHIASTTSTLACSSSTAGALKYNSTGSYMEMCNGTSWQPMGVGVPAGTISAFASTTCPTGWSEYTLARGRFLRGIDNGAGNDPSGTRVAGDVQEDAFKTHTSDISPGGSASSSPGTGYIRGGDASGAGYNITITSTGGTTETRPKNVAVTYCQFNGTTNGWNSSLAGPGASVLSDLTDVTFSGLASGNSLLYNGSAWVNQTLDKIVSGTTNVTARTDGTISFTTGGVTTGYFDTAGRLVVPGISVTTKQTSVTTLYASGNIESDGVLTLKNTTAQLNLWGEAPVAWKWSIGDSGDSTDDLLIYDREHSAIRLIIDDTTGSVGINTSSPQYPLDVSSTSSYAIRGVTSAPTYAIMGQSTNSSYGGVIGYSANSSNYGILGYGNGYGGYFDGTTYGAYGISSAGTGVHGYSTSSIGVRGQSSTYYGGYFDGQYGVYAVGNVGSATANAMYNSNSAGVAFVANNTGTGKYCYIGYTSSYALYCDGPVYSSSGWVNPSDKRLKTDIRPIQSALDKLTLLNGVEFEWKDKTKHKDDKKPGGFIAQDVKKIFPEFVEEKECVENKETGPNPECEMVGKDKKILMLKLSNKFNAYVVEAMKELKTENDTLKAQLSDMEKRLQALEAK